MSLVSILVRLYAALLLGLGVTALFAPELAGGPPDWTVQVLAAALLAFASSAWLARDAPLGGIYGRPVVGPQQTFAFIGALVAARHVGGGATVWSLALTGVLALGALFWSALLLRPAWLGAGASRPAGR